MIFMEYLALREKKIGSELTQRIIPSLQWIEEDREKD